MYLPGISNIGIQLAALASGGLLAAVRARAVHRWGRRDAAELLRAKAKPVSGTLGATHCGMVCLRVVGRFITSRGRDSLATGCHARRKRLWHVPHDIAPWSEAQERGGMLSSFPNRLQAG